MRNLNICAIYEHFGVYSDDGSVKTILFLALIFTWILTIFNIFIISIIHVGAILISKVPVSVQQKLTLDKPKGPVPFWINLIVDFCLIAILASNSWIMMACISRFTDIEFDMNSLSDKFRNRFLFANNEHELNLSKIC